MSAAPLPADEASRLRALHALEVLDTAPDTEFDALVQAAAAVCGVPISLVSLVDTDRQWFKAATGLGPVRETPRDVAFCAHAIHRDGLFEVPDAWCDERFATNPLVVGDPGIRFYAGTTLTLQSGARVGTLCVIDRRPRSLDAGQRKILSLLGKAAAKALETRHAMRALAESRAELEASEARFRSLSDGLPLGMYLADADGRILHVNARMQEILGLGFDECLGFGWHAVLHPDDRIGVLADWRQVLALGLEHEAAHRVLRRDGSAAEIHVRSRPIRDASGRTTGHVGSVEDATERLALTRQLAENEAQLRWLYESTPAMLCSVDAHGHLVSVSDRWLSKLGYRREEVLGRAVTDFTVRSGTGSLRGFRTLFAEGRLEEWPVHLLTRDGKRLDTRVSAVLERDASGAPLRGVCVIDDVTERVAAEARLHEKRRRLEAVIDATDIGSWEWNLATDEVRYHENGAAMLGLSVADVESIGISAWKAQVHPDDLPRVEGRLAEHLAGKSPRFQAELRLRHREGHWIWVLSQGRVVTRTADGAPEWMYGTTLDLRERKQQEEALRKSERFLDRTGRIAGIGGWELDLRTGSLFWSDAVCRMLDQPPGRQPNLDRNLVRYTRASRAQLRAALDRAAEEGVGWDLELECTTVLGRHVWMRNVAEVERVDGRPVRLIGAAQDITAMAKQRQAVEQVKERLALATDSGGIGIWELDFARQQIVFDARTCEAYGLPGPEATLSIDDWRRAVHEEDRLGVERAGNAAARGEAPFDIEFRIRRPDGSVRHLRATAKATRDDAGEHRLVGANWDLTPLRRLGAELAEQHELLRVTLQSIGDAVITTDAAGRVTWLNPRAERLTGWPSADARCRPLAEVFETVDEATREPTGNPVAACLDRGESAERGRPSLLLAKGGAEYGVEESAAPIRNERGEVFGAVLVFRDVTEKRRLAAEMNYRAVHDTLTGLVNRAEFEARLGRLLADAQASGSRHTLLFIDLDQFKLVNDACGHSVGDQLLQQVSRLLGESVRSSDTVARLGGDEFGIIVEHCPAEQAERAAQTICDRMNDFRFEHGSKRFRVGASIGLVPLDARWATAAALMQAADTSCYAAKEAGRNRIHVWFDTDSQMHARHGEMKWATRLEQALDENRFALFAQRIAPIGATGRRGVHAEVLLRLVDADGSLVAPGAFLPAAERFHLSSRVDRWVLNAVRDWLVGLPDLSPIDTLCVNLSGQSIGDRAFHRHALELLAEAGPAICRRLCLEITETAAVTNLADAAVFIDKARELGVRIALDDFGAGASSFGYLKQLKVDVLKIDGQFIRDFLDDPLDAAAVRCFVDVARVLSLKTVAEFVDRSEVLERLGEIGVDYAQGYLLHRPAPIGELVDVRRLEAVEAA